MKRFLLLLALLTISSPASAWVSGKVEPNRSCFPEPGKLGLKCCTRGMDRTVLTGTGDEWYRDPFKFPWYDEWMQSVVQVFGMNNSTWHGHGLNEANWRNIDRPLGQFFAAVTALTQSHPNTARKDDRIGSILRWGPAWVMNTVDKTTVSCKETPLTDDVDPENTIAYCSCNGAEGWLGSESINLFVPQYFAQEVYERAATLIHEARHYKLMHNWKRPIDKGDTFSGDLRWTYGGAWTYEVAWLYDYAGKFSINVPRGFKCAAARMIDLELRAGNVFRFPPPVVIDSLKICRLE